MVNASILVVDDDPQIRRTLRAILSSNGCDVIEAKNGQDAIDTVVRERPNLVLLDINMPDMNGLETCAKIRRCFQEPIIMVTVRSSNRDKVDALNSGADDYVVKPFSVDELLARIKAALRRSGVGQSLPRVETAELTVDLESRIVEVHGTRIHLTPREFEVLRALVTEQGKAVTYRKLLQVVWGPDYGEEVDKLRGVIGSIRKKIEKDPARPRFIVTEPWFGYRFQALSMNGSNRHKSST